MSHSAIRVALFVEAGCQRDELHTILLSSDRLQLVSIQPAAEDLDAAGPQAADVIILDDAPGSLEHARHACESGVPVVVFADDLEVADRLCGLRSGLGLLPRSATAAEVVAAIEAASAGLFVAHPDLIHEDRVTTAGNVEALPESLTRREVEVLHALAAGLGNKAIAGQLHISEHTAKFHVSQILAKLDAGSRAEAVSIAMRRGLLPV
jgi:DNA-binding NarL/FixJ family response regulator